MKTQNYSIQLADIQDQYKKELKRKDQFNIFTALHKEHNEKFLHSRFISYLLSPCSKHKMGNRYLKIFLNIILTEYPELSKFSIENCEVHPNEENKGEYLDIDILIRNDKTKQAIVIENKIYAGDSTNDKKNADNQVQLNRYCNSIRDKGITEIFAIYLTLDRHDPQRADEIKFPLYKIDYHREIREWLDQCIAITTDNQLLSEILAQYQSVIFNLTSNLERIFKFRELIENNLVLSWEQRTFICEMEDFKHIKWHTIADFWNELAMVLQQQGIQILSRPTADQITKVAHKSSKHACGLIVEIAAGKECYIVNDAYNGLTYGNLLSMDKVEGEDWFTINKDIRFCQFDDLETFQLISKEYRRILIGNIVSKIESNIH